MIAQNIEVSNIFDENVLPAVKIQYNKGICSLGIDKETLDKQLTPKNNFHDKWVTTEVTIDGLFELLKKGYAVRGGIKEVVPDEWTATKSGKQIPVEEVKSIQWFFIDFDNSTLQETIDSPFYKCACIWYYSPSYNPGVNEKHRLVFRLDREISKTEYATLSGFLIDEFYPKADRLIDAGRFFYAPTNPENVTLISGKAALPVDEILNLPSLQKPVEERKVPPKKKNSFPKAVRKEPVAPQKIQSIFDYQSKELDETQTESITELLHNWFWDDVIIGACDGEFKKFFEHYYDFDFKVDKIDKNSGDMDVEKWQGFNPFSPNPREIQSGESFVTSLLENGKIIWTTRNSAKDSEVTTNEGEIKYGGSVFDFAYLYAKHHLGRFRSGTQGENFIAVAMMISNDFGIPLPRLNVGSKWVYEQIVRDFSGSLYRAGWKSSKKDYYYIMFDESFKFWRQFIGNKLQKIDQHVEKNYSQVKGWIIQRAGEDLAAEKITKAQYKKITESSLSSTITDKLNKFFGGTPDTEFTEYPLEKYEYLPFQNGVWNHDTQHLEHNYGQAFNRKVLPFDYEYVPDDHPTVLAYKNYMDKVFTNSTYNALAKAWHILAVTNFAGKTGMCFGVGGLTHTFKSFYGSLINNMLPGLSQDFEVDDIFNTYTHSSAQLEGLRAFSVQELNDMDDARNMKKVLSRFGNQSKESLAINPKGEDMRLIPNNFAFTFDFEGDYITFPNTGKTGYFRRMITIRTDDNLTQNDSENIVDEIKSGNLHKSKLKYLLCWLIRQDSKAALLTFNSLARSEDVVENQAQSLGESNDVYRFLSESIKLEKGSELSAKDLYKWFLSWCDENDVKKPPSNRKFLASFRNLFGHKTFGKGKKLESRKSNGSFIYVDVAINDEVKEMLHRFYSVHSAKDMNF